MDVIQQMMYLIEIQEVTCLSRDRRDQQVQVSFILSIHFGDL